MALNFIKLFIKVCDSFLIENAKLSLSNEEKDITIKMQNATIEALEIHSKEQDETRKALELEIERLKNNNNKDSSNSSIPSSKNGFKKVKNSREKTDRKRGGQIGHTGTTLEVSKVKSLIDSGEVKHTVIDINKNHKNKDKPCKIRYVQDLEIKTSIREYRYYPNDKGEYNIPNEQNNVATYGSNFKAIAMLLVHRVPASMDQAVNFFNAITDGKFDITKSTIANWTTTLSEKLNPLIEEIKQGLLDADFVNTDESPINVDGKNHQLHNYSNAKYTLQYIKEKKSKAAMIEIGFLSKYLGVLVHDHNKVQYNFGTGHAECNTHILRYLKAVDDFTDHKWSFEMGNLLKEILHHKHVLLDENMFAFDNATLEKYSQKYDEILKIAAEEYRSDYATNAYKVDERRLFNRLKEYKDEHLLFMYDFSIPFSNNRAETDIRPAKRKQTIGIFRSQFAASCYAKIRSFISTFLKNNKNIFEGMKNAFDNKVIALNCLGK